MNLLILDDDQGILQVVKENCEMRDINCTVCTNYDEAIELCKQVKFDIILIDWFLREGRNGIDFAKECRLMSKKSLIIIITAYELPEDVKKNSPWVDEWYDKPISIGEMLALYCTQSADVDVPKPELDELIENQKRIYTTRKEFNEMINAQEEVCREKFVHNPKLISLLSAIGAIIVLLFTAVAAYWVNHDKLSVAVTENKTTCNHITSRMTRLEHSLNTRLERIEDKMDVLLEK